MAWAALTTNEIRSRMSGPELAALQGSALATGQSDPLPEVIAQVTDEVRGYIAARGENTLGPAGTLPAQARSAAIAIVRWRLAGRISVGTTGTMMQGESRRKEYEDAMETLKDIAKGLMAVEKPAEGQTGPEVIPTQNAKYGSEGAEQNFLEF